MTDQERFDLNKLLREHAQAAHKGEAFLAGQISADIMSFVGDLLTAKDLNNDAGYSNKPAESLIAEPVTGGEMPDPILDKLLGDFNRAILANEQKDSRSWDQGEYQRILDTRAAVVAYCTAKVEEERAGEIPVHYADYLRLKGVEAAALVHYWNALNRAEYARLSHSDNVFVDAMKPFLPPPSPSLPHA